MRRLAAAIAVAGALLAACGPPKPVPTLSPSPSSSPASPSPAASSASPVPTVSYTWPPTTACGVERWPVKTGTDPNAGLIDLAHSQATTIAALSRLGPPAVLPQDARIKPVEVTQYTVTATLAGYKMEGDSDYHLILQDAAGPTSCSTPACW